MHAGVRWPNKQTIDVVTGKVLEIHVLDSNELVAFMENSGQAVMSTRVRVDIDHLERKDVGELDADTIKSELLRAVLSRPVHHQSHVLPVVEIDIHPANFHANGTVFFPLFVSRGFQVVKCHLQVCSSQLQHILEQRDL